MTNNTTFTPATAKFAMFLGEAITHAREICETLPEFRCQAWIIGEEMPRYSWSTINGDQPYEVGNTGETIESGNIFIRKTIPNADYIIIKNDVTGETVETILIDG